MMLYENKAKVIKNMIMIVDEDITIMKIDEYVLRNENVSKGDNESR